APPRLPGGLGEVGDLGQAVARLPPRAVGPVALHAALPEQLAYGGVSRRHYCRRPRDFLLLGLGRFSGRTAPRILGQLASLLLQVVHDFLKEAALRLQLVHDFVKAVIALSETRRGSGFRRYLGWGGSSACPFLSRRSRGSVLGWSRVWGERADVGHQA